MFCELEAMTKITSLSVRQRQVLRHLRAKGPLDFLKVCALRSRKLYAITPWALDTLSIKTLALMELRGLIRMEGDLVWATGDGLYALRLAEEKAESWRRRHA